MVGITSTPEVVRPIAEQHKSRCGKKKLPGITRELFCGVTPISADLKIRLILVDRLGSFLHVIRIYSLSYH